MNKNIFFAALLFLTACAAQKKAAPPAASREMIEKSNTRTTTIEYINQNTYLLTEYASDPEYGFIPEKPVKVGGVKESSGPQNERRFLNALLGPNGEELKYHRAGSCCPFASVNGFSNTGLLDRYLVYRDGSKDTLILYLNMYDIGDLYIPKGFTAKK